MEISEVKKGMHVVIDGELYQVIDFLHVKSGKGAAFMSTKIKNVRTGATLERNFNTNYKVDEARINRTNVQYLYNDGSTYYFMDNNTFDQVEIPAERIGDDKYYLIENNSVDMASYNGELLGITIPEKLEMTVVSIDPGSMSSSSSKPTKDAVTETGLVVKIPVFINEGEKIIVTTCDGKYYSRA